MRVFFPQLAEEALFVAYCSEVVYEVSFENEVDEAACFVANVLAVDRKSVV